MPASWSWLAPFSALDGLARADQRNATARHDAFLDCGTGGVQRIFHAGLLFLHFHLGRGADLDQRHTAGQLGYALLQLFLVVVAGGFVDLLADVLHPRFDLLGIARAVDDGGFFLAHLDALGLAQIIQSRLLELQADLVGDHRAAGQDGDVFQHGLAAVAEAGRLDRRRS